MRPRGGGGMVDVEGGRAGASLKPQRRDLSEAPRGGLPTL